MFRASLCHRCLNVYLCMLHSQNPTLKVRVCHRDHMFTVFSSASSVPKTEGWTCCAFGSSSYEWAAIFVEHANQHGRAHVNSCYRRNNKRNPRCCSISLHHWMALLLLSRHPVLTSPLPPSMCSFSLSPFPCVSSSCVGGRLESPESTTRITRSISETISFSHLFYMVYPSISLSFLPLCHSLALCG